MKRRPGRKKRGSSPPDTPPLPEWDFGPCPPNELSECERYEYSRSSILIRETIARRRAGEDDPLTRVVLFSFPVTLALWLPQSNWWPGTPFLMIPEQERSKRASFFR